MTRFLRGLNEAVDRTHLRAFTGQTLVVDALSWLHKACYGCAYELSTGRETDKYVQYMLRKVDMMRSCGVAKVILVFDGQRLPLKSSTQEKRQSYKEENRKRALQALAASKRLQGSDRQDEMNKAYQLFQRSVSITPQIIANVMKALRAAHVPFVVAPFEADAQMVWMCKEGLAAGIVTEDSDVVVYGLTANVSSPVLVKLEDDGSAQAVSRSILHKNSKASSAALLKKIHFLTSGEKEPTRMFVQVCILAGCDFIDSLPNVGFATAVKHIFNFRGAPSHLRVQRLVSKLSSSGTKIPTDFMQQFLKAETIFFHHIVFNPKQHCCEFLINESHGNCFPDILQRAKESLGIESVEHEVDLATPQEDLHILVTSTKSFLGQVRSREVVEQIYKGEVCARSLRSLSEGLQEWESDKPKVEQGSFNSPSVGASSSADCASDGGFPTYVAPRQVSRPPLELTAEQLENKKRLQANERVASLQGLINIYKSSASTQVKETESGTQWLASSTRTRQTDVKNSSNDTLEKTNDTSAFSAPALSSSTAVVKATKVTTTSMKDLIAKHSQSTPVSKSMEFQALITKATPQSAPEPRKRPAPVVRPITNSAKKARILKTSGTTKKTLFDFFQKQT
ncbi:Exonuclease 1 [Phytophthora citrophthora]|uniref:Exonuclease 1 n=1 Tax=Phytophthora citrophthora TaxID=4793 RepID=A0AAD9GDW0_9STRA|nr:Exonuclease 1 [Phytophthora citrophthora]